jgi:diguanylate cyclase (GGDEF)-like protein/PAS domain S-box-containing protein
MVASALVVLTPVKSAFVAFTLPALLPLIAVMLAQGDAVHFYTGAILAAFMVVMLAACPIVHNTHVTSLRARFENASLVERLSAANRIAEDAIRQLSDQLEAQKRIEAALQVSTDRVEALVAASPLGIIVQDEQGVIKRWNQAAERIFGWTEQEAMGQKMLAVPADRKGEGARFRELILRGEQLADFEAVRKRKDGKLINVSLSAAPLRDASGVANGIVLIVADISGRKRGELLQQLEHTVTRVLAESRSVDDTMPLVLRAFGELSGWAYGARWVIQEDQRLRCQDVWHDETPETAAFAEFNRQRRQVLGDKRDAGLLRRVWNEGKPAWVADIARDATLERTAAALQAGLKSGFGFPVLIAGKFYGVMEFFARDVRPRDDDLIRIASSIGSQIGQFIARKEAESNLTFFANHDALTGLPNRAMFNERLAQALARAHRYNKMAAVLFIDLDRFKIINDTLGHDAGDRLLKQLAERLRECLREGDTVGRQGGDEFVVLIEDVTDPNQVTGVAQKMLETIAQPYRIAGQEFHVTASIGISICPDDGRDQHALLKNADIAMYRAKERGKNNYQFYSAQMNLHSFERLALETSLRHAVERSEFLLHYQPKVNIRSGRITGVEALVRWQHPELGMVSPAQFIPLAEETGLIVQIGEWVLRTACSQARGWLDQGLPNISVAVNLSARQFARDDLAASIMNVVRETGMDPRWLELEITESTVMHNPDLAAEVLRQLKDVGVRVAIDDFGTGYSSLGYLKRFPIDSVKVDRSFILDIPDDKDDVAITCAVIAMAHSLRLKVVAEGVETAEQYGFLRDQDCDEIQGYYFSPPVEAASLARLLARSSLEFNLV